MIRFVPAFFLSILLHAAIAGVLIDSSWIAYDASMNEERIYFVNTRGPTEKQRVQSITGNKSDPGVPLENEAGVASGGAVTTDRIRNWGNQLPSYPELALQRGWEGTVRLRLKLDEEGKVAESELLESSGRQVLDRAALSASRSWIIRADALYDKQVEVPVEFVLAESR